MNVNNSITGLLYWEVCRSFLISNLRPRLCLSVSQLSDGVVSVSSLVVMCGAGCQLCCRDSDSIHCGCRLWWCASACSFRPYLVIGPSTWLALSLKQLNINELSLRWLQISVTRCNGWHAGVLSWPGWFIGPLEMSIKLLILQGIRGRQGIQSTVCAMRFIEVTSQHPEWPSENINITTTRSIRPLPSSLGSSKSLDHFQEIWIPWERIDGADCDVDKSAR